MAAKIYLSYGMEFADYDESYKRSIYIRNKLIRLGYNVFNPHTDEIELKSSLGIHNKEDLPALKNTNPEAFHEVMQTIIDSDIEELHFSDAVIAYLDKSARGGVPGELTIAHLLDIPVYSIVKQEDYNQISGWTYGCSDKIFNTVDECLDYIANNPIEAI